MSLRWLLAALVLALLFVWTFSTPFGQPDRWAVRAFSEENYSFADQLLSRLKGQIGDGRYFLNRAYIQRAQGNMEKAEAHLERSERSIREEPSPFLQREWLWNMALQALLTGDTVKMHSALRNASWDKEDPWWRFMAACLAYEQKDFQQAHKLWSELDTLEPYSAWMEGAIATYFPLEWRESHRIRAAIYSGHHLEIREGLTNADLQSSSLNSASAKKFLALTHFQEAREKAPEAALVHFRKAVDILQQLPAEGEEQAADRQLVVESLREKVAQQLQKRSYQDLNAYLRILEGIQEEPQDSVLVESLTLHLIQNPASFQAIIVQIPEGRLRKKMMRHFLSLVQEALHRAEIAEAEQWALWSQPLSTPSDGIDDELRAYAFQNIDQLLMQPEFKQLAAVLTFWKKRELRTVEHLKMSLMLLQGARERFVEVNFKGALDLMQLALAVSHPYYQAHLRLEESQILNDVYRQIVNQSSYKVLPALLAMQYQLGLSSLAYQGEEEIANLLADGYQLYYSRQYRDAQAIAQWVLAHQPSNIKAQQLAYAIEAICLPNL